MAFYYLVWTSWTWFTTTVHLILLSSYGTWVWRFPNQQGIPNSWSVKIIISLILGSYTSLVCVWMPFVPLWETQTMNLVCHIQWRKVFATCLWNIKVTFAWVGNEHRLISDVSKSNQEMLLNVLCVSSVSVSLCVYCV